MMHSRRWFAFVTIFAAFTFMSACDDDPIEPEDPADEIATIRLTIGAQTVDMTDSNSPSVTIPRQANAVAVTFLDAAGVTLPNNLFGDFEIRLESENAARVTFTRTGAFTGTLTGLSAGAAVVQVSLFHIEEGHNDFGPRPLAVTVQ
jgi:hypothetical protein